MNWLTNLNTQRKWGKTCAMESTGDEYEKKKEKKSCTNGLSEFKSY